MKKTFIFLLLFSFVLAFIFRNFLYTDIQNNCSIVIIPSTELSNRNIIRGLILLKNALKNDYDNICSNVKVINTNVGCGGYDGGCYYGNGNQKNTIFVSTNQRDFVWTANVLVHETCHLLQHKENRPIEESECYKKGDDVLKFLY